MSEKKKKTPPFYHPNFLAFRGILEGAKVMWKIKQLVPQLDDQSLFQKEVILAFRARQDSLYLD